MSTELLSDSKNAEHVQSSYPNRDLASEDSVEWIGPRFDGNSKFKHLVERVIAACLLVVLSPIILVLWITVKATSCGSGFYTQARVGQYGKVFRLVKLRSMCCNAELDGKFRWSTKSDTRVTRLGKILRKLHLDELPQLWNVARGDMSLVGPRPERPEITVSLEKLIPHYHARHRVKPGITGLAQVNLEPDTNINVTRKKQVLDLRYIENSGLWLDLRLIFATGLRVIGVPGNVAMEVARLRQAIDVYELEAVGYEFETPEEELWNPSKGSCSPQVEFAQVAPK